MFFLLKSAFWLALVYAAMLYGFGPSRPVATGSVPFGSPSRQAAISSGYATLESAVTGATKGVETLCAQRLAECLGDAARLTALFDSSGAVEPLVIGPGASKARHAEKRTQQATVGIVASGPAEPPMPVADPRRQGRVSRLTSRL